MAFILKNSAGASREDIDTFERRIGMRLPQDYKLFLAANNGGKCVSGGVFCEASTGEKISRVNIVLGLRQDGAYSLDDALPWIEAVAWEPESVQLLPVAYDSGGNKLLLDCSDERRGTVYFLRLESWSDEPDNPTVLDALAVVARSFTELLAQIESDE